MNESTPIRRAGWLTRRQLIEQVPARWDHVYGPEAPKDKRAIGNQLKALRNPTADQIDQVIGNPTWTTLKCDGCRTIVSAVALIDTTHGEYVNTAICRDCLQHLLNGLTDGPAE